MKPFSPFLNCREALGLAFGFLMLLALPWRMVMLSEPAWLFLVLLVLACMAGFAGGGFLAQVGIASSQALRFGASAAFLASLVAASIFALSARATESWFYILKAGTSGLMSLLPVTFYGMICAGRAALTLAPVSVQTQPSFKVSLPSPRIIWSLRVVIALLVLLAVVLPPAAPHRMAQPFIPAPVQHPFQAVAPRPVFTFTPAEGIDRASAMQWRLLKQREVPGVDASTLALSPDDHYAACMTREQQMLQVIDLRSETVWRINLPGKAEHFSFHPTADRLLVVWVQNGERIYGVANIRQGQVIALPKPRRGVSPSGTPFWWQDTKVLIVRGQERLMFNLDTLEVDDAAEDEEWKALDPLIQQQIAREAAPSLMDKTKWQWEVRKIIRSSELPEIALQRSWPLTFSRCLVMSHPDLDCMKAFPSLEVAEDERLCSTRDGSVVLRSVSDVLHLYYFDIEPLPDMVWKISMPHAPEEGDNAKDLRRALEAGQLAALVYRPMINPLNQQVVGPVRSDVSAVLRFKEWKGKEATVYLWQLSSPIKQGDVIADVCALSDEPEADLLKLSTPHRWWTRMPATADSTLILPKTLDRDEQAAVVRKREYEEKSARTAREEDERRKREAETAAISRMAAEKAAAAEAERKAAMEKAERDSEVAPKLKELIVRFVQHHHQKSLESDVRGMVADYAGKVDYFTNGEVDQAWILRDEETYHNTHSIKEERILRDVTVKPTAKGDGYEVTYDLHVLAQNLVTLKVVDGVFSVRMIIAHTAEGLRIILQHSEKKP